VDPKPRTLKLNPSNGSLRSSSVPSISPPSSMKGATRGAEATICPRLSHRPLTAVAVAYPPHAEHAAPSPTHPRAGDYPGPAEEASSTLTYSHASDCAPCDNAHHGCVYRDPVLSFPHFPADH